MTASHRLTLLSLLALLTSVAPLAAQPIPRVIVETDMGGDTDDAAMVAFANRLADQGLIELLAVMHNGNNEWGGAAISAINTYYGRPELPIGTYRTAAEAGRPEYHPLIDPLQPLGPRRPTSYTGTTVEGGWVRLLAGSFPCQYQGRLEFPDAVDVYKQVLPTAPFGTVIVINGGFLGNLANMFAWFEVDWELEKLVQRRVRRMTGAVGGVNTCNNSVFPNGMAAHVVNNPVYETAPMTWLGPPTLDLAATQTNPDMATMMPVDNPVRQAYQYKTEVEHGFRNTSNWFNWHIIDVATGFSSIAWDEMLAPAGSPYFEVRIPEWVQVVDNCSSNIVNGTPPVSHWEFESVGLHVDPGQSVLDASQTLRTRLFDEGLYAAPATTWSPERDHRAITAVFEDGTFGGLDFASGNPNTQIVNSQLVAPSDTDPALSGANLSTEGRRYFDQTALLHVRRIPQADQFSPQETSCIHVDYAFWGDLSTTTHWGNVPIVRVTAWPGRGVGNPASPGVAVYRVSVWDDTSSGYMQIASQDLTSIPVGEEFKMRVQVQGNEVQCAVDGVEVFPQPLQLQATAPFDGGISKVLMHGRCPQPEYFELGYVMIRPDGGDSTIPDVHIDKDGTVWFSYLKNGHFLDDLMATEGGLASHFVDIHFKQRPGWAGDVPVRLVWQDSNPATVDWLDVVFTVEGRGIGDDHWLYGLPGLPWMVGDEVVLEYRGRREGEQIPR